MKQVSSDISDEKKSECVANADKVNYKRKLIDYDINIDKGDDFVTVKKKLRQVTMEPVKRMKLMCHDVAIDNGLPCVEIDKYKLKDIYVKFISNEEADKYVVIKLVSFDPAIPAYIQLKKTTLIDELVKFLRKKTNKVGFELLREDGSQFLERQMEEENRTIGKYGFVDNESIYMYYGNVTVQVMNPINNELSDVEITPDLKGLHLKDEVCSKLEELEKLKKSEKGNVVLLVTNAHNTKFEMVEDDKALFKYGITENAIIKWVKIENLDNIEINNNDNLKKTNTHAKVLTAKDKRDEKQIALKVYSIDFQGTKDFEVISRSKAFGNELINFWRLRQSAQSEKIVQMLGIHRKDSNFYFAMELMKESLRDVLDSTDENIFTERVDVNGTLVKRIKDSFIKDFTRQIIEGLEFLHSMNILHRNLKCSSVLLDDNGNVKLCSFGLSKYIGDKSDDALINGLQGSKYVDSHWTSPESLEHSIWSVLTDVWSLGATMVEMRTGNKPYHKEQSYNAVHLIRTKKCLDNAPSTDPDFDDFIKCCTQGDPQKRSRLEQLSQHRYLTCDSFSD